MEHSKYISRITKPKTTIHKDPTDILLLFPPQWHPGHPNYALPALVPSIQEQGYTVAIEDCNDYSYRQALSPQRWKAYSEKIESRLQHYYALSMKKELSPSQKKAFRYIEQAQLALPYIQQYIQQALEALTSPDYAILKDALFLKRFFQTAFRCISAAYFPTKLGFSFIEFNKSPAKIAHIFELCVDVSQNPYLDWFNDDYIHNLLEYQPAMIGVSILSDTQLIPGFSLIHKLRSAGFSGHITIGGSVLTRFSDAPHYLTQLFHYIDSILFYESEQTLPLFMNALLRNDTSEWTFLSSVSEADIEEHPAQDNLAQLLWKQGDTIHAYFREPMHSTIRLSLPDFGAPESLHHFSHTLVLPYLTSRGCYHHNCVFCERPGYDRYSHDGFYQQSPEQVVYALKFLQEKYHTSLFYFVDEALHPRYLDALSRTMLEQNLACKWICYGRFDEGYSYALLEQCFRAGLKKIWFGFETLHQRQLDRMNKAIRHETREQILRDCIQLGIGIHLFIMVGFALEQESDFHETIQYLCDFPGLVSHPYFSYDLFPLYIGRAAKSKHVLESMQLQINPHEDYELEFSYPFRYLHGVTRSDVLAWKAWGEKQLRALLPKDGLGALKSGQDADHLVYIDFYERNLTQSSQILWKHKTNALGVPEDVVVFQSKMDQEYYFMDCVDFKVYSVTKEDAILWNNMKQASDWDEIPNHHDAMIQRQIACFRELGWIE